MTTTTAVRAEALTKTYRTGDTAVSALDGVDLDLGRGELTAIMGPSGSGKSTFMHCLAGLDRPTDGRVWIGDTDLGTLSEDELTCLRRDRIGFVFQEFNLLPTLSAAENITLPGELAGRAPDRSRVEWIAAALGIADRLGHRPAQLSGGQQQRVACARALLAQPDVIFADEPTGALDTRNSTELLGFLRRSVNELGQTVVLVTHDPDAAAIADRVVILADGRVVDEIVSPDRAAVLDRLAGAGARC